MKQQRLQQRRRQQDSPVDVEKYSNMKRQRVGLLPQQRHSSNPITGICMLSVLVIVMIIASNYVNAVNENTATKGNQQIRLGKSIYVSRQTPSTKQEIRPHWESISNTVNKQNRFLFHPKVAVRRDREAKLEEDLDQEAQSVDDDELPAIEDSIAGNDNDDDDILVNTTKANTKSIESTNSSDGDYDLPKSGEAVDSRPDVTLVNITMTSKLPELSLNNTTNFDYHKDKPTIVFDDYDEISDLPLKMNATDLVNDASNYTSISHNDTSDVTSTHNGTENSLSTDSNATSVVDASQSVNAAEKKTKTDNNANANTKPSNASSSQEGEEDVETSVFDFNNPFDNDTDESASVVREESLHGGNDTTDDDSKFDTSKEHGTDESESNTHSTTTNGSGLGTSTPNKYSPGVENGMINDNFENNSIDGISTTKKNSNSFGLEQPADSNELLKELTTEERRFEIIFIASISISVILMIFTAYQMSENPDGLYASLCRFTISIILFVWGIIRYPCHKPSVRISHQPYNHLPLSTKEYGYNDPALEIT